MFHLSRFFSFPHFVLKKRLDYSVFLISYLLSIISFEEVLLLVRKRSTDLNLIQPTNWDLPTRSVCSDFFACPKNEVPLQCFQTLSHITLWINSASVLKSFRRPKLGNKTCCKDSAEYLLASKGLDGYCNPPWKSLHLDTDFSGSQSKENWKDLSLMFEDVTGHVTES